MDVKRPGPPLALLLLLAGCSGVRSEPPASSPDATFDIREGGRLFARFCTPCHGEAGRGDGNYLSASAPASPPDFAAEGVRDRLRKDLLIGRLSSSEASGEAHCPPWGSTFSSEEIQALATFVEPLRGVPAGGLPEAPNP